MAERAVEGHSLGSLGRRIVVEDNLPVLIAIVAPGLLFILAGLGAMSLSTAYTAAIYLSLAALFGLGLYEGRTASMSWPESILSGAAAGTIGLIVVAVEAFFE
jgi:VIT1/CCC1 family predicted Fe2+/Mn2+ transporter